jgi:hypothetical protein
VDPTAAERRFPLSRFILPIGALAYLLADLAYEGPRPLSFLPFLLSLLSFLPRLDRVFPLFTRLDSIAGRRFRPLLTVVTLLITAFYAWLWGARAFGFQPVVHDEFAYLFQVKTFLAGRLFFPSPPEPVFFDAFHVLTGPVYAAKYPPGHALLLLPGAAFGVPWLVPLVGSGAALFLLGLLARPLAGSSAALLLVSLFGLSPAGVQTATSYLSQTTYLAAALLFLFFWKRSTERGGLADPALAGVAFGALFLIRHWNAIVLGLFSLLVLALVRGARPLLAPRRRAVAFLLPVALVALAGGFYNRALTGSMLTTPWELYAERSQPEDRFGFYHGEEIEKRESGPGKLIYNERVLYPNRTRYTAPFALRSLFTVRIPMSSWEAVPPVAFVFLAPLLLLIRSRGRSPALFALGFALFMHAAYLLYWFPWGPYYHEITPLIIALPLLGARELLARAREEGRGGVALAVLLLLGLVAVEGAARLPFQIDFRREKASTHARFERLVERKTPPGSILFIRYGRNHNPDLDLINNDPDLSKADRILVYDFGEERNSELRRAHFPLREPFHYDESTRLVNAGYGPP